MQIVNFAEQNSMMNHFMAELRDKKYQQNRLLFRNNIRRIGQLMAYLGSVSGRDEDKIGKAGLTPVYADNTVYFEEAKLVLICKKLYQSELQESGFLYQETIDQNYPQRDLHTMYVGKIEKVLVRDDEYLK